MMLPPHKQACGGSPSPATTAAAATGPHAPALAAAVTAAKATLLLGRQRRGHVQFKAPLCQLLHILHHLVGYLLGHIECCSLHAQAAVRQLVESDFTCMA